MARATAAGLRAIPTGIAHGTVTVLAGKQTFEVTTLREDIATDGRHANVLFGRDFRADALRRDFTMNALSMTRDGRLFDYTGGLADIAAGKVRFIGEPSRRIEEDYLRILRFFRFSADFGKGPLIPRGARRPFAVETVLPASRAKNSRRAYEASFRAAGGKRLRGHVRRRAAASAYRIRAPSGRLRRALAIVPPQDPLLRLAALCVFLPEDAARLPCACAFPTRRRSVSNAWRLLSSLCMG